MPIFPKTDLFRNSKLKIERAKQHICDVQAKIWDFASSDFYKVSPDKDPKTGQNQIKVEVTQSFPTDTIALITGDAIHNLRSALDIAISDIILKETGKQSAFAKFPFRATRDNLIAAINGGLQKFSSPFV